MRLNAEDEHVSIHGRFVHQKATTGQTLLKAWSGNFSHMDLWNHNDNDIDHEDHHRLPYPRLPVSKLISTLAEQQHHWKIESIRISHVQLLGSRHEFARLAMYLTQCHTLKTVLLSDCKTSRSMTTPGDASGFDALLKALSKTPQLQEVSLQNMSVSGKALGALCTSTSLTKLQVLLSQSLLPTGCIPGNLVRSMAQELSPTPSTASSLKELRIFGVLDYEACQHLSEMLLVNRTLQKLSLKIKLQPTNTTTPQDEIPLLAALQSPSCGLSNLELYLSGARSDIEHYAKTFSNALQTNQSLQQLNIILYGLETAASLLHIGRTTTSSSRNMSVLATLHTNDVWMEQLEWLLRQGNNYVLQQIMMNHGMIDMSDTIKLYLRLNRAGRGALLRTITSTTCNASASGTGDMDQHITDNNTLQGQSVVSTADEAVVTQQGSFHNQQETTVAQRSEIEVWIGTLDRVKTDVSSIYYLLSSNPTLFCEHFLFGKRQPDTGNLPLKRKR